MIDELHVSNLALIEDASIEPCEGLTVLTGETGAGKSALLSAVKLLMGERASGDLVRDGADGLSVEGRFFFGDEDPEHPDGRVVCRRVNAQGRSRVGIDGSLASVAELARLVGSSVDLCGQHEHQKLLSPANHLALLDAWAGESVSEASDAYKKAWSAHEEAARGLERLLAARSEGAGKVADARFVLARIDDVSPREGEYEELEGLLPKLEHAEALASASNAAYECLRSDGGALETVAAAISQLEDAVAYDPALEPLAQGLHEATFVLEDASDGLRRYRDSVEFDPEAFERAESRMGELVGLMRSFGPTMSQVFERREEARSLVAMVDDSEELERRARAALDAAEKTLLERADVLLRARRAAAPLFAGSVCAQMGRLEMGGAALEVQVDELPRGSWTSQGPCKVEFLYRPGPASSPRPFARIASGGEVSRVMLAVKVALGERDDVQTLVFDEIDAGVGGSTARAVGMVLADLAATHQVIVVTHLAQIAVMAQRHYVVSKGDADASGVPVTAIAEVRGEERLHEVARMLSGDDDPTSVAHAAALISQAGLARPGRAVGE